MTNSEVDFRNNARQSLVRAKIELTSDDQQRWRYAALELRDAMEAVTYDRALAFKDDLPPEDYKTWQPRKLLAVLVEIDPSIGKTSTLLFGEQTMPGQAAAPEKMKLLGTDVVLTMKDLKEHYDALGSYLHMPSLGQLKSGKVPNIDKLRDRCSALIGVLDKVLASPVWNVTLGNYATLQECRNSNCKKPVKRRLPHGAPTVEAKCNACGVIYDIKVNADHAVLWEPRTVTAHCADTQCQEPFTLFQHETTLGTRWHCPKCNRLNEIVLGIRVADQPVDATSV